METSLFSPQENLNFIKVWVSPGAKKDHIYGWVKRKEEVLLKLSVRQPPEHGKANEAVLELVSDFLKVPKSSLCLKTGLQSRLKGITITR